jgi:Repeat of unknown function (DUF346)
MSGQGQAASTVDQGELSSGRRRALAARRVMLVASLAAVLLVGVVSVASASSTFYWYGENNSTCWQTGQPGASSSTCDGVGAGFLNSGGHTVSEGAGIAATLEREPSSGDYCSAYNIGEALSYTDENGEYNYTGLVVPKPYGQWQQGDAHETVCQADGANWGQEVRGNINSECTGSHTPCGMQHDVSFASQGTNDRPWSSAFGGPSLLITTEAEPYTASTPGGGWGYVCPLLRQGETNHVLEFCLELWRTGTGYNNFDVKGECSNTKNFVYAETITEFANTTKFATEMAGSANTFVFSGSPTAGTFTAYITEANLINAINAANSGCPGDNFSTNPSEYALVGVEEGMEGRALSELGGRTANLQLRTEYSALNPPTVTTEAATGVQQTEAVLHGTVNPHGIATKYHFEYGPTTSYGTSPAEGNAGSGSSGVSESATVTTGLKPGTVYHYRLVATSAGGEVKGNDQTFTTELMPKGTMVEWNGTRHVYYRGLNGQLHEWYWNGTAWSQHDWGSAGVVAGTPTAVVHSDGNIYVYYRSTGGQLAEWWYGPSPFTEWSYVGTWGSLGAVAGDPSAVVLPNNSMDVYYRSSSGQLGWWWFGPKNPSTEWTTGNWGSTGVVAGTPTAVAHSNNNIYVYYRSTGGQLAEWWYGPSPSSEWSYVGTWGSLGAVAGDPSAVVLPNNSMDVYYRSSSGQLGWWWFGPKNPSTEWTTGNWGSTGVVAGTPTAVAHSNNNIYVYYRSTGGQLAEWWYGPSPSSEWSYVGTWGSLGAVAGDPTAGALAAGGDDIYYGGTSAQLWQWYINGSNWNLSTVGSW